MRQQWETERRLSSDPWTAQRETITARTGTKRRAHDRHEFSSRLGESVRARSRTQSRPPPPWLHESGSLSRPFPPCAPTARCAASFNHRRDPRDPVRWEVRAKAALSRATAATSTSGKPRRPIDLRGSEAGPRPIRVSRSGCTANTPKQGSCATRFGEERYQVDRTASPSRTNATFSFGVFFLGAKA